MSRLVGENWSQLDDPRADGWESEALAARAGAQLAKLAAGIESADDAALTPLVAASFRATALRPDARSLDTIEVGDRTRVRTWHARETATPPPAGAERVFASLLDPIRAAQRRRTKFKVVGVELRKDGVHFSTRVLAAVAAWFPDAVTEQHATWRIEWTTAAQNASDAGRTSPRIEALNLVEFVETRVAGQPLPIFVDRGPSVFGANASWSRQLGVGLGEWLEVLQDTRFMAFLGAGGIAVGDVNGDDLDDVYLCQEGGLPNLLFVRQPDGRAVDVSEVSGVDWLESSRGALLVDLDNDGDRDLAVVLRGCLAIAANDGGGRFDMRALLPTAEDTFGLAAADFDIDGDLDLYVTTYKSDDLAGEGGLVAIGGSQRFVYHDAENGGANVLFRNDSRDDALTFRDVTQEIGLDENNRRFSFAASWEDFDDDGDQDLYVANDFGRNNLYRNDGGRFVDVAATTGTEDSASGMGVAWGDIDNDGDMDLHVSNMFSAAGQRITTQGLFKPESDDQVRTRLRRFARGNTLLRLGDEGRFDDVTLDAAVATGRWAWSSTFVDIDNDARQDLVVANGYITASETSDL